MQEVFRDLVLSSVFLSCDGSSSIEGLTGRYPVERKQALGRVSVWIINLNWPLGPEERKMSTGSGIGQPRWVSVAIAVFSWVVVLAVSATALFLGWNVPWISASLSLVAFAVLWRARRDTSGLIRIVQAMCLVLAVAFAAIGLFGMLTGPAAQPAPAQPAAAPPAAAAPRPAQPTLLEFLAPAIRAGLIALGIAVFAAVLLLLRSPAGDRTWAVWRRLVVVRIGTVLEAVLVFGGCYGAYWMMVRHSGFLQGGIAAVVFLWVSFASVCFLYERAKEKFHVEWKKRMDVINAAMTSGDPGRALAAQLQHLVDFLEPYALLGWHSELIMRVPENAARQIVKLLGDYIARLPADPGSPAVQISDEIKAFVAQYQDFAPKMFEANIGYWIGKLLINVLKWGTLAITGLYLLAFLIGPR